MEAEGNVPSLIDEIREMVKEDGYEWFRDAVDESDFEIIFNEVACKYLDKLCTPEFHDHRKRDILDVLLADMEYAYTSIKQNLLFEQANDVFLKADNAYIHLLWSDNPPCCDEASGVIGIYVYDEDGCEHPTFEGGELDVFDDSSLDSHIKDVLEFIGINAAHYAVIDEEDFPEY